MTKFTCLRSKIDGFPKFTVFPLLAELTPTLAVLFVPDMFKARIDLVFSWRLLLNLCNPGRVLANPLTNRFTREVA